MAQRQKKPRSLAFTATRDGKRYLLDSIPEKLWRETRAKAKREHVSVRALILTLLTEWTAR